MFRIVSSVAVMMRGPPGEPRTISTVPSLSTMVGAIEDSGRLPGAMALASPCTRPNWLGDVRLEGEVVHLVIHQEAGVAGDDAGAESAVDGVGHGDGVAVLSMTEKWVVSAFSPGGGAAGPKAGGRDGVVADQAAQVGRVVLGQQPACGGAGGRRDRRGRCCGRKKPDAAPRSFHEQPRRHENP